MKEDLETTKKNELYTLESLLSELWKQYEHIISFEMKDCTTEEEMLEKVKKAWVIKRRMVETSEKVKAIMEKAPQ